MLERLDWRGVVEMEFKIDDRDGRPMLLEVNPRLWENLDLPIHAGVNFPALLCELALTGDVLPPESYGVGRKVTSFDSGFWLNLLKSRDRFDYLLHTAREYANGADTTVEIEDFVPHVSRAGQLGWRALGRA